MIYPLYPYESRKLSVIFVYGTDFTRRMNITMSIPEPIQMMAGYILLFVVLAAIILRLIRKKWKLRRDGLFSTFIDTMIAFIDGGNLRMQHKFERWFFGVLLIAAFFISSLFVGDLLDCVYRIIYEHINTFEQLAQINSSIYISSSLNSEEVYHMLRFDP